MTLETNPAQEPDDAMSFFAFIVGVLEAADDKRPHSHQCPGCEHVWSHIRAEVCKDDDANIKAHTCPSCGQHESWKHYRPKKEVVT